MTRSRKNGFTLLEVLLVIFLIALSAVAVVSNLPESRSDDVKKSANSLYRRLQLLSNDATLSGQDYGLFVDEPNRHFLFLSLTDKGWQPTKLSNLKNELDIDDSVDFDFDLGGGDWIKDDDRLFKPGSLFEDMGFKDDEDKKTYAPQVILSSSGIITSFSVHFFSMSTHSDGWTVKVSPNGEIRLMDGDGVSDERQ